MGYFGVFAGPVVGGLTGGISGLALGSVTTVLYRNSAGREAVYRRMMTILAIIITYAVNVGIFFYFARLYSPVEINLNQFIIQFTVVSIPALVTAAPAAYASQRVAKWYLQYKSRGES